VANPIDDPQYWRQRAQAIRKIADATHNVEAKSKLAGMAKSYDLLAEEAEERRNACKPKITRK
jgi:hypothetical protein